MPRSELKYSTHWHRLAEAVLAMAPRLIVIFEALYRLDEDGQPTKHLDVAESVGIACGFSMAAFHQAGLRTLTHTPNSMGFLAKLFARPKHERAFVLMPDRFAAEDAEVPDLV